MLKKKCSCEGCESLAAGYKNGLPYCNKHWLRIHYNGTTELLPKKTRSKIYVAGDKASIITSNGDDITIDAEDIPLVKDHSWCLNGGGYPISRIGDRIERLSHVVLKDVPEGCVVDHINGDVLDNRKSNLRICTQHQNSMNKGKQKSNSGHTGIRITRAGRFATRIVVNRVEIYLGTYGNLTDAIAARTRAEHKYFGDYAPSNRYGGNE